MQTRLLSHLLFFLSKIQRYTLQYIMLYSEACLFWHVYFVFCISKYFKSWGQAVNGDILFYLSLRHAVGKRVHLGVRACVCVWVSALAATFCALVQRVHHVCVCRMCRQIITLVVILLSLLLFLFSFIFSLQPGVCFPKGYHLPTISELNFSEEEEKKVIKRRVYTILAKSVMLFVSLLDLRWTYRVERTLISTKQLTRLLVRLQLSHA